MLFISVIGEQERAALITGPSFNRYTHDYEKLASRKMLMIPQTFNASALFKKNVGKLERKILRKL
jgi:hypothetical protein